MDKQVDEYQKSNKTITNEKISNCAVEITQLFKNTQSG